MRSLLIAMVLTTLCSSFYVQMRNFHLVMIAAVRVHISTGIYQGGDKLVATLTMGSLVTADVCACGVHMCTYTHTPVYMRSQVNHGCRSLSPSICYLDGVSHWPGTCAFT